MRYMASQLLSKRFMMKLHKSLNKYSIPLIDILATEIFYPSDHCTINSRMISAKYPEIRDLLCRGTFKVKLKDEVPEGANVLTACFVLAIKPTEHGEI